MSLQPQQFDTLILGAGVAISALLAWSITLSIIGAVLIVPALLYTATLIRRREASNAASSAVSATIRCS